jgi:hypothetical protein
MISLDNEIQDKTIFEDMLLIQHIFKIAFYNSIIQNEQLHLAGIDQYLNR